MNSGLDLIVHHLFAVYSGGKLSLDGAGYQPNTNQTGTGVGTGTFVNNLIPIRMVHEYEQVILLIT